MIGIGLGLKITGGGRPAFNERKGLITWLKLDDGSGTNAADASGNGKNGTLEGSPAWALGYKRGALTFDGTNRDVLFAGASGAASTGATWTLAFWIKPNTPSVDYGTVFGRSTTDTGLYLRTSLKMDMYYGTTHLSTNPLTDQAWNHVAVVCNAGAITQYLNGVANGTSASGTALAGKWIGKDQYSNYLKASIDDFHFYDIALTASNISTLARSPSVSFAPNAPTNIQFNTVTQTAFNVTWTASATDATHAAPTSYEVRISNDGFVSNDVLVSAAATSPQAVSGLVAGTTYTVRVTATNNGGTSSALQGSQATLGLVPVIQTYPTISIPAHYTGQLFTTTNGTWTNSPSSYAWRWFRNGVAIGGATSQTYVAVDADIGMAITSGVIASNAGGPSAEAISSNNINDIISSVTFRTSSYGGNAQNTWNAAMASPSASVTIISDSGTAISVIASTAGSGKNVTTKGASGGTWSTLSLSNTAPPAILSLIFDGAAGVVAVINSANPASHTGQSDVGIQSINGAIGTFASQFTFCRTGSDLPPIINSLTMTDVSVSLVDSNATSSTAHGATGSGAGASSDGAPGTPDPNSSGAFPGDAGATGVSGGPGGSGGPGDSGSPGADGTADCANITLYGACYITTLYNYAAGGANGGAGGGPGGSAVGGQGGAGGAAYEDPGTGANGGDGGQGGAGGTGGAGGSGGNGGNCAGSARTVTVNNTSVIHEYFAICVAGFGSGTYYGGGSALGGYGGAGGAASSGGGTPGTDYSATRGTAGSDGASGGPGSDGTKLPSVPSTAGSGTIDIIHNS